MLPYQMSYSITTETTFTAYFNCTERKAGSATATVSIFVKMNDKTFSTMLMVRKFCKWKYVNVGIEK